MTSESLPHWAAFLGVGAAALYYLARKGEEESRFNRLAEGLTTKERAVARKFWDAGKAERSGLASEHAAAMAELRRIEALRVATDRLDKALALLGDPTCHPQVAEWLVKHWMREFSMAVKGETSHATRILVGDIVDERINRLAAELTAEHAAKGLAAEIAAEGGRG